MYQYSDWPMFGANPQRTFSDDTGVVNVPPTLKWTVTTPHSGVSIESGPIVAGGKVFFLENSRRVKSSGQERVLTVLDADSGNQKLQMSLEHVPESKSVRALAVIEDIAYCSSNMGIYAVDAGNGTQVWETSKHFGIRLDDSEFDAFMGVTVHDEVVYTPAYTADAHSGQIITKYKKGFLQTYLATGAPLVLNNIVYMHNFDDKIIAWNASTGQKEWELPLKVGFEGSTLGRLLTYLFMSNKAFYTGMCSTLATDGDLLYVGSMRGGKLNAVDVSQATIAWELEVFRTSHEGHFGPTPTVAYDKVFFFYDKSIGAADAAKGTYLWQYLSEGSIVSIAVSGGVVYFARHGAASWNKIVKNSFLGALDAQTGELLWEHELDMFANPLMAVAQNTLYIGVDGANRIMAFQ